MQVHRGYPAASGALDSVSSEWGRALRGAGVGIERSAPGFAMLLRRLRTSAGLTQDELAESASLSPRTISDLERGVSVTARVSTARLLAAALNLTGSARTEFLAAAYGSESHAGASSDDAGSHRLESGPGQHRTLPRDISAFTGRVEEVERTVRAVTDASAVGGVIGICAIGGMAGIGKTTLAVHAAHTLAPQFPDGQLFVPLHAHTPGQRPVDPSDALAGLLLAAGIDARGIPADRDGRERCWRDYLAGRTVLLVLDDAAGHDQVGPLLPGSGRSTALVTSRQRLTALDDAAVIDLDILPEDDAVGLLVRLSGRTGLHPGEPGVAEIARLCGCLPLAIGMLARQLHHHPAWTPAGLAAELAAARDRLDLMRSENVSVAAAFHLSYRNLTAAQRRLFRRLGLHPGPDIDRYAAAALADTSLATARRNLGTLYDQHLLTEPAAGRYRLHDLLRQHARTLAAAGNPADNEAAIARILDYYMHTARAAAGHIPHWLSAPAPPAPGHPPAGRPAITTPGEAFGWMETERANLYAIADYTAETARPAYTIALSAAMAGFLEARGPWDKAISLQQAAVAAADHIGDKAGQARNMNLLGQMQAITGNSQTGAATSAQALEIYRDLGDAGGQADTLSGLANLHTVKGNYQLAADYARQAMTLFADSGLYRGQADVLCTLGTLHEAAGDYPAAAACFRQARQLSADLGDPWGQLNALTNLGSFERQAGDYATAEPYLRQALALACDCQDRYRQAFIMNELGVLQRMSGDYRAAAASLGHALEQFREIGQIDGVAIASNDLGLLQQLTGDYQAAATSHRAALAIYTEGGQRPGQADALNSLGELFISTGDPAEARDHHTRALRIARDLPAPLEEARALEGIGRSHFDDDSPGEASGSLRQALEIYERLGTTGAGRIREMLAQLPPAESLGRL